MTADHKRPEDVRAALLAAAEQLIEAGPASEVSLRACARLAGVSHAAPAHYFPSKAHLMAAVLTRAFDDLSDRMEAGHADSDGDGFDRLKAIGLAYIGFALDRPNVYAMMFSTPHPDGADGEMAQAGARASAILAEAVARTDRPPAVDQALGVTFAWVNVHGFVSLLPALKPGSSESREATMAMADRMLSLMATAFRA